MNRKTNNANEPSFDAGVYEDAPADIAAAIEGGGVLPHDFLPSPDELVLRTNKETMTLRIDSDVLEWFRSQGKGYQTRINAVLRSYKTTHEDRTMNSSRPPH